MHDVYKNIDDYNPDKENKILIIFNEMIADMIHNKKLNSIVIELFIRGGKLNISLDLLPNHILRFQKMLLSIIDVIKDFLSQKSLIKENLNKLQ